MISSLEHYSHFDQMLTDDMATFQGATPEEMATLAKFGEAVKTTENNRFRLDPVQSYVSKEVRAMDPEFWSPK